MQRDNRVTNKTNIIIRIFKHPRQPESSMQSFYFMKLLYAIFDKTLSSGVLCGGRGRGVACRA